nr:zinc finger BED domain-containing protein DAYSLEEPER-like [Ipomoea batatas]
MKVKAVKLNPFLLVSSKVEPYFQISFQHQVINSSSTCDLQLLFYIQVHYQPWISPATIPHKLLNPFLKARRTYANLAKLLEEESLSNTSDFDIIAWWKCVGSRYPLFQKMAKDILAIPISSVALESVFSIGGRLFEILIDYGSDATVDDYSSDAYYYDSADPPSWLAKRAGAELEHGVARARSRFWVRVMLRARSPRLGRSKQARFLSWGSVVESLGSLSGRGQKRRGEAAAGVGQAAWGEGWKERNSSGKESPPVVSLGMRSQSDEAKGEAWVRRPKVDVTSGCAVCPVDPGCAYSSMIATARTVAVCVGEGREAETPPEKRQRR